MKAVFSVVSISQGHADLHTHTHYSGFNKAFFIPYPESVTPPERMVDAAVKKGLDVLCITDHDEIEGALRAQRYSRNMSSGCVQSICSISMKSLIMMHSLAMNRNSLQI